MDSGRRSGSVASGRITRTVGMAGTALFLVFLVFLGLPGLARGNTCNGLLTIDYVGGPAFPFPGDVVRVRLTLGTGSINGGTKLVMTKVRFSLDCDDNFALTLPCTDEGSIIEYEG